MLSNGITSEIEKIRQGSVDNYLSLIKLRLQKNQKPNEPEDNG